MVQCNICANKIYQVIYPSNYNSRKEYLISDNVVGLHQEIVKCSQCDLIFVNPIKTIKSIYQALKKKGVLLKIVYQRYLRQADLV